jgi:hypothetical protein
LGLICDAEEHYRTSIKQRGNKTQEKKYQMYW